GTQGAWPLHKQNQKTEAAEHRQEDKTHGKAAGVLLDHAEDEWREKPSQAACGTHKPSDATDGVWKVLRNQFEDGTIPESNGRGHAERPDGESDDHWASQEDC